MITFPEWLKSHRKAARLTQHQLANLAGVSKSYVSAVERRRRHSTHNGITQPSRTTVQALAKALAANEADALIAAGYMPETPREPNLTLDIGEDMRLQLLDGSRYKPAELAALKDMLTVAVGIARQRLEAKK